MDREVDRGSLFPYKGNYSTYLETKAKRLEAQGQQQAKLAKRMERELEWVRSSPKARQAKNKARLERYEQMEAEARQAKKLDFTEIQIPGRPAAWRRGPQGRAPATSSSATACSWTTCPSSCRATASSA